MKTMSRAAFAGAAFAAILTGLTPAQARAQIATFRIPAAPLASALTAFAKTTNRQIIFSNQAVQRFRTAPLTGVYTPEEALTRLLEGTGLGVQTTPSGVLIVSAGAPASVIRTAAIQPGLAPAQPTAAPVETAEPELESEPEATLGEIVVTARRRSESLQEVPQSVTAVTADTLQKLNIQRLEEITTVTPGLSLTSAANGYTTAASMRGVSFQSESAAAPTVAFYLNDAPVESTVLFQSLFDVGQIEVLRGPQGTVRGISAPSGAITLTTRKPNLSEFGGYVNATATDLQGRNVHGAFNAPLISDVLGLRVAAIVDQNDLDGVRSLTSPLRPRQITTAVRTSLGFEPSDRLNALVTYLHIDRDVRSFVPVAGAGAGYNGPILQPGDRLSVQDELSEVHQHLDVVTAEVDSRIFGQHLTYVGSYAAQKIAARNAQDTGNQIPGREIFNVLHSPQERTSHEIRLASDPAPGRRFDYTVGVFYQWVTTETRARQPRLFPGFFGSPASPSPFTIDPRYRSTINIYSPNSNEETSFFGSVTAYLGDATELTLGGRQIINRLVRTTNLTLGTGLTATTLPAPLTCAIARLPSTYPGYCDAPVAPATIQNVQLRETERPFIYNVSLSHRISRDLLVYANHGTSWRGGPGVVGITNGANPAAADPSLRTPDPVLAGLQFLRPETSRSYEIGFKSTLLDGRARLNVAVFRQKFNNLIIRTEPVRYLSYDGRNLTPALFPFTTFLPLASGLGF